jgi:hypothetical protein
LELLRMRTPRSKEPAKPRVDRCEKHTAHQNSTLGKELQVVVVGVGKVKQVRIAVLKRGRPGKGSKTHASYHGASPLFDSVPPDVEPPKERAVVVPKAIESLEVPCAPGESGKQYREGSVKYTTRESASLP